MRGGDLIKDIYLFLAFLSFRSFFLFLREKNLNLVFPVLDLLGEVTTRTVFSPLHHYVSVFYSLLPYLNPRFENLHYFTSV